MITDIELLVALGLCVAVGILKCTERTLRRDSEIIAFFVTSVGLVGHVIEEKGLYFSIPASFLLGTGFSFVIAFLAMWAREAYVTKPQ